MSENSPTRDRDRLSDELLVIRCQLGEPDALEELVGRWNQVLWRYVRHLIESDDDAADTLQNVWMRVLRGLPGLRDGSRFRPWLFRIARRAVADLLRADYARPSVVDVDIDSISSSDDEPEILGDTERVRAELARMPVIEREVLLLFHLRDLTLAEVADVLEVPTGTVKSRLHRARIMLRRRLTDQRSES